MFRMQEFYIPDHMQDSINRYIKDHTPVGSFLQAVIENNLMEAVARADDENLRNLPAFVSFFYNLAPTDCWKSPENYKNWIANKGE